MTNQSWLQRDSRPITIMIASPGAAALKPRTPATMNSHPINMIKIRKSLLIASLLLATSILPAGAQDRDRRDQRDRRDNREFYNGVRGGGRGGQYNDPRYDNRRYNERYNNGYYQNQGGIGPGKGALIGGAGGAALGAIFGRGLKGTIIGGAAGAGIGAVVGEVHQKNQRNQYYPR